MGDLSYWSLQVKSAVRHAVLTTLASRNTGLEPYSEQDQSPAGDIAACDMEPHSESSGLSSRQQLASTSIDPFGAFPGNRELDSVEDVLHAAELEHAAAMAEVKGQGYGYSQGDQGWGYSYAETEVGCQGPSLGPDPNPNS